MNARSSVGRVVLVLLFAAAVLAAPFACNQFRQHRQREAARENLRKIDDAVERYKQRNAKVESKQSSSDSNGAAQADEQKLTP